MIRKVCLIVLVFCVLIFGSVWGATDDFPLKRGDTRPAYPVVFRDSVGVKDLTGCSVFATMENATTGTDIFTNAIVTVTSAVGGEGEYRWVAANTNTIGAFYIEFKVIDSQGNTSTYPTSYNSKVIIRERF